MKFEYSFLASRFYKEQNLPYIKKYPDYLASYFLSNDSRSLEKVDSSTPETLRSYPYK
jgi:hypothetical protein